MESEFPGRSVEKSPQMEIEGRILMLIKITLTANMKQTCLLFGGFARKEFHSNVQYNSVS